MSSPPGSATTSSCGLAATSPMLSARGSSSVAWGAASRPRAGALGLGSLLVCGHDALAAMETTHCVIAGLFVMRLGLGIEVRDGLQHVFERWDGKGAPAGIAGEEIALSARIVVIADIVECFRRLGGMAAAVDVARRRAGGQFDPRLAEHVCENADALLGGLDEATGWDAAIAAKLSVALSRSRSLAPGDRPSAPRASLLRAFT